MSLLDEILKKGPDAAATTPSTPSPAINGINPEYAVLSPAVRAAIVAEAVEACVVDEGATWDQVVANAPKWLLKRHPEVAAAPPAAPKADPGINSPEGRAPDAPAPKVEEPAPEAPKAAKPARTPKAPKASAAPAAKATTDEGELRIFIDCQPNGPFTSATKYYDIANALLVNDKGEPAGHYSLFAYGAGKGEIMAAFRGMAEQVKGDVVVRTGYELANLFLEAFEGRAALVVTKC
jgi:hypothetical protein